MIKKFYYLALFTLIQSSSMFSVDLSGLGSECLKTFIGLYKATASTTSDLASWTKKHTWDMQIGDTKHGGKIVITSAASLLVADQLYNAYYNRYRGANDPKRLTVVEKCKKAWGSIDQHYKDVAFNIVVSTAVSIFSMVVMKRFTEDQISSANAYDVVFPGQQNGPSFKDVVGHTVAKEQLENFKDYILNPKPYEQMGVTPVKGILMAGAPGIGKTELVRAFANEAGVPLIKTDGSQFNGMYRGSGTALINKLKDQVATLKEKYGACIVFIDEADSVLGAQSQDLHKDSDRTNTVNTMKAWLDGFDKQTGIFFVGATNNIDSIDPAMIRSGRYESMQLSAPSKSEFAAILENKLQSGKHSVEPNINIDNLVNSIYKPGMTGADVKSIIQKAGLMAVKNKQPKINDELLKIAAGLDTSNVPSSNSFISDLGSMFWDDVNCLALA